MKIELPLDAAQWVQAELAAGRLASAEYAGRYAIDRARRAELPEMLDASEAEGGSHRSDDARHFVRDRIHQRSEDRK